MNREIDDEIKRISEEFETYVNYLESIKDKIPPSVYEFATAEWHFNTRDARCPHDAWLEEIKFGEIEKGEKFEIRPIEIYIKLLGAYHNGHIEIRYENIHSYSFNSNRGFRISEYKGEYFHGDWLRDEIRLSENEFVIHEIEWENGNWQIEAEDIEYKWIPFDAAQTTDMNIVEKMQKDKEVYKLLHEGKTGVFTKSCGFIGVAGSEAVMFLNGLITNDVAKLEENSWMSAAFPNAQGRLLAVVRVLRQGDKFLFVTENETYEKVLKNLERFTLAGDFQVNDLSEKMQLVSIRGENSAEILNGILNENLSNIQNNKLAQAKYNGVTVTILKPIRENGFDIIAPKQQANNLQSELLHKHKFEFISENLRGLLRIEQGIPLYGIDMDETTIVPEIGLENLVSYNKGCYIGQEIIARIHFRGHIAKQLTGLVFEDENASVKPSDEIKSLDGKNAGKITSAVFSPKLEKTIALAYVRYDYLAEGTELKIGELTATVKDLPFVG